MKLPIYKYNKNEFLLRLSIDLYQENAQIYITFNNHKIRKP